MAYFLCFCQFFLLYVSFLDFQMLDHSTNFLKKWMESIFQEKQIRIRFWLPNWPHRQMEHAAHGRGFAKANTYMEHIWNDKQALRLLVKPFRDLFGNVGDEIIRITCSLIFTVDESGLLFRMTIMHWTTLLEEMVLSSARPFYMHREPESLPILSSDRREMLEIAPLVLVSRNIKSL